jgi:PqqD family protein of HPr-rel-A system
MWRRQSPPLNCQSIPPAYAIFDPSSGDTHFLSELPTLLLQSIDHKARSALDLLIAIAGEDVYSEEQIQRAEAALRELEKAGLVEYVDCVS